MELTLLRHAALPLHLQGRYIGHTDIGIDPERFDAGKISPLLNRTFDRVYSSDLVRCTQTLETMGIDAYLPDPRLREVRFKSHIEGKLFEEIEAMEGFDPRSLESAAHWHRYVCEESAEMFRKRIHDFLDELPRNKNILICTHAGTIREILSLLGEGEDHITPGYLEYTIVRVK